MKDNKIPNSHREDPCESSKSMNTQSQVQFAIIHKHKMLGREMTEEHFRFFLNLKWKI